MIWLGLGTALLVWAATGGGGKWRLDWITIACAVVLAAGAALAPGLYDDLAVLLIVLAAAGAALALRRLWPLATRRLRLSSMGFGAAAIGFALFGPAEGLF